ncbi:hypothetical protein JTE90_001544 [Oedothorax gibbosus]|uniref:Deformed epidermal autoregulatory factor 1 n=1 Tax=Oedothorax gibbosus TaxID=931172 RepID=A0AAV6VPH3_9ARAC|nr:hypothetical protein JTE90_001544 [Oedothorax gibbosus]
MNIELVDEDLPSDRSGSEEVVNAISGISESSRSMPPNVLVTTGGFFGDQDSLKTTRIIIHNPSLDVLKNQTITFNPLNRSLSVPEKNNNWDPSVYDQVLPVRCRDVRGELHKNKFGSGNRGHCILANNTWYTPSEFESFCGRGNSKDWKRSIRYGGRTLMCLIDQGILRPHATSCTCGACCEDTSSSRDGSSDLSNGPVRLFTPYKRRKRQNHPKLKVLATNVEILPNDNVASAPADLNSEIPSISSLSSNSIGTLTMAKDAGSVLCSDSVIVTPEAKSQTPRVPSTSTDFNEQKHWWQLEEMVKNSVRQILDLQKHVEILKNQCSISREAALQEVRVQLENEKKEALSACRLEAQISLSRTILEAKSEKETAIQQALEQSRLEMEEKLHSFVSDKNDMSKLCANCNREAFSECTGCHRVSYCSPFCQKKDWLMHKDECGEDLLDADCSELIDDCDGPSSS